MKLPVVLRYAALRGDKCSLQTAERSVDGTFVTVKTEVNQGWNRVETAAVRDMLNEILEDWPGPPEVTP